jgi:hypothetical protein
LAQQGDATAIATLLTQTLHADYALIASALRLGNYLSIWVEITMAPDPEELLDAIEEILKKSVGKMITTVVITAQQVGHGILWSKTVDLQPDDIERDHLQLGQVPSGQGETDQAQTDQAQTDQAQFSNLQVDLVLPDHLPSNPIAPTQIENPDRIDHADHAVHWELKDAGEDPWTITFKHLLKRPELVAVLAFAIAIAFWDAYVHWAGDDLHPDRPFSANKLARRLGVSRQVLNRHKHRNNFDKWSQDLDPEDIAWQYDGKVFLPKV